jgi:hypothetical protein
MPTEVATLQTQLRLARAQNADLHCRLQTSTPSAPSAPTTGLVPTGQRGPEGFASLEEENAHLKARLAKATEAFRTHEAEYTSLAKVYEEERRVRIKHERDEKYWFDAYKRSHAQAEDLEDQLKRAGIPPRPNYQWLERGPALDDVLKQILTLAHPDKWGQGQPATALAHELTIAVNRLRQHDGRRA